MSEIKSVFAKRDASLTSIIARSARCLNPREWRRLAWILAFILLLAIGKIGNVLLLMSFVRLAVTPAEAMTAAPVSWITEWTGATRYVTLLGWMALLVLVWHLAVAVVSLFGAYLNQKLVRDLELRLSAKLLRYQLNLPYEKHTRQNSAQLIEDLTTFLPLFVDRMFFKTLNLVSAAVVALAMAGSILTNSPTSGLLMLGVLGGAFLGFHALVRRRLRRAGERLVSASYGRTQVVGEVFRGFKEIQTMNRAGRFFDRFRHWSAQTYQARLQYELARILPSSVLEILSFSIILFLTLILMSGGKDAAASFPVIALYAAAGRQINTSLQEVFSCVMKISEGAAIAPSICDRLEKLEDGPDADVKPAAVPFESAIEIQNATYTYPSGEDGVELPAALRDISLRIPKGQVVGFVGSTGSGKSTLVDLLLGLLTPRTGSVRIDGVPLDTPERQSAWFAQVGYVPQQMFLTDLTIAENIAFGPAGSTQDQERVREVARIAQIEDYIVNELPGGFEAKAGESGIRLSGGQRQRIGIARALFRNPEVLLFDEATSALDGPTESRVMSAIHAMGGKKTIILVAHRLDTVKACDVIHILEGGRLVESGTYEELSRDSERFRTLACLPTA